jgi:hypothetical protein
VSQFYLSTDRTLLYPPPTEKKLLKKQTTAKIKTLKNHRREKTKYSAQLIINRDAILRIMWLAIHINLLY